MKRVGPLLVVLLLLPASAHGAGWKSAGTIFADGEGATPVEATVDHSGAALFAYPGAYPGGGLFVSSRPRGGPVAPRHALAANQSVLPGLAGNARGEAALTWIEADGGSGVYTSHVVTALRTPDGSLGSPQTLIDGVYVCDEARVAMSNSGQAIAVFVAGAPGSPCVAYASVRAPGSDHFDPPVQLSTTRSATPQVALDDHGNGLIAWVDQEADEVQVARYLAAGGGLQPAEPLSANGDVAAPSFGPLLLRVSGPTGAAIIAFPVFDSSFAKRPAASIGTTQGGFDRARLLAGPSSFNSSRDRRLDAAAGADGTLAVVWRGGDTYARHVKIARVGPGAESITHLDTNSISDLHAAEVAVAIADGGRVTVAWSRRSAHGKHHTVEVATCAPSRRCAKPQRLSSYGPAGGARPEAATSSTGAQFVTWLTSSAVEWAKGSPRSGRFGKGRVLESTDGAVLHRLYRGRRGAMLATVSDPRGSTLFTYGER